MNGESNVTASINPATAMRTEEERWPEIELAEQDPPDGREKYEELSEEFVSRFWTTGPSSSFEEASAAI